ncbi:MAG: sulfurtransferase TusA family protein [Aigarchaeota archaeon]|nr:sulfurtransferase TusA family protein [Aigarchaeota archaeon]MCS7127377.1 sulfurtransferase TusA family protein [Candidatus Calditenuaceae archaeon]MDW8042834.1 sulfurtransferase TusA family protein [Nitrososphaerota archaeon]
MRRVVDARGSFCPGPLTELIKAYKSAEAGDEIELLATDPGAKSDVSAWAKKSGNEVLEIKDEQGYFRIVVKVVRKGR